MRQVHIAVTLLAILASCGGGSDAGVSAGSGLPNYSPVSDSNQGDLGNMAQGDRDANSGAGVGVDSTPVGFGNGSEATDNNAALNGMADRTAAGSTGVNSGNSTVSGAPLQNPTTSLPRSTPEAQGLDPAGVLSLVNALDQQIDEVHSLMLLRHGNVVAEGFWAPYVPQDVHVLYSVSKSFNATAVGLAQQAGLLSITDTVVSHFSDLAPAAPAQQFETMQLRDLLMMASGHQADTMDTLRARADGQWSRAFLETQVQNQPGTNFVYNSGASYMLASTVQRVTGQSVLEYLGSRLFEPLGIGGGIWGESPEGVALAGGGLALRTEDLAKFGQLYLQGGQWNGEQILDAQWVADATSVQISTGNNDGNWNYGYGYQFWRSRFGYRADGSLGQFIFVLPEQDAVLIITSATNDTDQIMNIVWDNLMPAFATDALAGNPTSREALEARLNGLALPTPTGQATSATAANISGARFAMQQNNQGIVGVALDFSSPTPTLTIEDADGRHDIAVGLGQWERGRTRFKKRINELFDTPEQGISAIGAWSDPNTFATRLSFNETPYVLNAEFRFEGQQVYLNMGYNIRWGSATEPQIVGAR